MTRAMDTKIRYPQYSAHGRTFLSYTEILLWAKQYAMQTGQRVALMETLDAWTPAHVLEWIEP